MPDQLTEEDGHELAAYLMRDLSEDYRTRADALDGVPEGLPEEEFRELCEKNWKGNKSEILHRYLAQAEASDSAALRHGFFAALTDAIARINGDCPSSWEEYLPQTAEAP